MYGAKISTLPAGIKTNVKTWDTDEGLISVIPKDEYEGL